MKTVAFYSYKGGTGKSLGAANLAVCLSRLGINCAIMDLDFEGPSLHNKFTRHGKKALGSGGLLRYIRDHIQCELWPKDFQEEISFKPFDEFRHYSYPLIKPIGGSDESKFGNIHFITAGDYEEPDYWNTVWSPMLRTIYSPDLVRAKECISQASFKECKSYLSSIIDGIKELSPAPEYLILDFQPGANEFSATLISQWVDLLLIMFVFNEDNFGYLSGKLEQMRSQIRRSRENEDFDVFPVLSRVPASFEFRSDSKMNIVLDRLNLKDISILHSDRELEMEEKITLGYLSAPETGMLAHDYVNLFKKIIDTNDYVGISLAAAIGLPEDNYEKEKNFRFESDRGALINPNDNSRNVSFRVETFQLLLSGLRDGMVGEKTDMTVKSSFAKALKSAGSKCGHKFGLVLSKDWMKTTGEDRHLLNDAVKVSKWCVFDSDIGFGKFSLVEDTVDVRSGRLTNGDIILRESFLTAAEDVNIGETDSTDLHLYCDFMEAYIQGVLQEILGNDVLVKHFPFDPEEFLIKNKGVVPRSESCIYRISRD